MIVENERRPTFGVTHIGRDQIGVTIERVRDEGKSGFADLRLEAAAVLVVDPDRGGSGEGRIEQSRLGVEVVVERPVVVEVVVRQVRERHCGVAGSVDTVNGRRGIE